MAGDGFSFAYARVPLNSVDEQEFHDLYAAFVSDGGLDTTHVINEDYERSHKRTLCKHSKTFMSCETCYKPLPKYFPNG